MADPGRTKVSAAVNCQFLTDRKVFADAGAQSALLMRDLWNKRVAQAQEIASKQGSQFVRVKDISPFVRRMAPLYSKFMADPTTREELLTIVAN